MAGLPTLERRPPILGSRKTLSGGSERSLSLSERCEYSLTEEVKLTVPGEGKSLPYGGFHALRKNEEACSITLTHISALNAAACDPEPVSDSSSD